MSVKQIELPVTFTTHPCTHGEASRQANLGGVFGCPQCYAEILAKIEAEKTKNGTTPVHTQQKGKPRK